MSQVIRDHSTEIVIPKAAQMAFTVTFLTRTAHWITERGWHHLYLLPLKTGAIPFVQARIDPMLDSNPKLGAQFANVDNRLHKQSKTNINWYIRGTNIVNELQEIPVDVQVWDERDRMVEDNLEDARHRMDGSKIKKLTMLSTPTVPGHGVDADDAWHRSDMHRWEVPCPSCGRFQVLNFEDDGLEYSNLRMGDTAEDCVVECAFCHKKISDEKRAGLNALGRWVPYKPDGVIRGYHISQFNSPSQPLAEIMKGWFTGQSNARKLKSFYNNSLGKPYVALGDQFTPEILDGCRGSIGMGGIPESNVYVGIDIGTFIHVRADTLTQTGKRRLWQLKIFKEWEELDHFLSGLTSFMAVCDMHPEKRAARDLARKYRGRFWMGYEMDRDSSEDIATWHEPKDRGDVGKVTIDRTLAFDTVINRYINGNVVIPRDARDLGEHLRNRPYNGFYYQMCQMVRVEEENSKSMIVARWKKNRNPDHWHHADMFCEVATMRKPGLVIPSELSNAFAKAGGFVG